MVAFNDSFRGFMITRTLGPKNHPENTDLPLRMTLKRNQSLFNRLADLLRCGLLARALAIAQLSSEVEMEVRFRRSAEALVSLA
jgi:hypothetical protein